MSKLEFSILVTRAEAELMRCWKVIDKKRKFMREWLVGLETCLVIYGSSTNHR